MLSTPATRTSWIVRLHRKADDDVLTPDLDVRTSDSVGELPPMDRRSFEEICRDEAKALATALVDTLPSETVSFLISAITEIHVRGLRQQILDERAARLARV